MPIRKKKTFPYNHRQMIAIRSVQQMRERAVCAVLFESIPRTASNCAIKCSRCVGSPCYTQLISASRPRRSPIVSYSSRGRLTVHTVHTFVATNAIGGEDIRLLLYNFVQALRLWLMAQLRLLLGKFGLFGCGHVVQKRLLATLFRVKVFVEGIDDCISVFDR